MFSTDRARDMIKRALAAGRGDEMWRGPLSDELMEAVVEIETLRSEVAVAKERYGPAGYKILTEVRALRARDKEASMILLESGKALGQAHRIIQDWLTAYGQSSISGMIACAKASRELLRGEA